MRSRPSRRSARAVGSPPRLSGSRAAAPDGRGARTLVGQTAGNSRRTADDLRSHGEDAQWNRAVLALAAEESMSYPFDPELAAAVAMMPVVEITDIPSGRTQMGETFAAMYGEPDRSGVQ